MSNVPKGRRTESRLLFYENAQRLNKEILQLLERDFGTRKRSVNINFLINKYEIEEDDILTLEEIKQKYGMKSNIAVEKHPEWIIDKFRNDILLSLSRLFHDIISANSIYIETKRDYKLRREYWNNAIADCHCLLQDIRFAIEFLGVNIDDYLKFSDLIMTEIRCIKGLKRSDKKTIKRIKENKKQGTPQQYISSEKNLGTT